MVTPIRLLLIDDHAAFRIPLAILFEREADLTVVGQAGSLSEARSLIEALAGRIDLALVDLMLPDGDGVVLVREVCVQNPGGQVIVLTASTEPHRQAAA